MKFRKLINQSGFTLIEIIATVAILAAFSAIMLVLFSDSLIKSSDALRRIFKSSNLSKVMASINADYTPYPRWKASTSYAVGNKILPTGMNGRFYICKTGGTSGTSEPKWYDSGDTLDGSVTWNAGVWVASTQYNLGDIVIPTSPNGHFYRCVTPGIGGAEPPWPLPPTGSDTVYDVSTPGAAQWKRLLGYLNLQIGTADANLKDNSYGKYYVIENRFVKFISNTIQPVTSGDPENVLEVKIKNDEGETLTALFTAKEN